MVSTQFFIRTIYRGRVYRDLYNLSCPITQFIVYQAQFISVISLYQLSHSYLHTVIYTVIYTVYISYQAQFISVYNFIVN